MKDREIAWLSAAAFYSHWFGFSVLPMGDNKRPLVTWKDLQTRRPNQNELIDWPKENIAIITGELSGVAVIDCESAEDYEWFWRNRSKSPMVCKTRRGYHLYFRHPGGRVANAQRVADEDGKPRYDVRGDGGYVLAPPSKHSEGEYQWISMPYRLSELPVFDLSWRPDNSSIVDNTRIIHDGEKYISQIRATSGQGGHNDTFRAAQALRASGLREAEAMIVLQNWNRTNADPPWSDAELLHKIKDVYK